jgi:hypothetical protein
MKRIPKTENSLLLRTDFSDDAAWDRLCAAVQAPVGDFRAYVSPISDPQFDGLTVNELVRIASTPGRSFCLVADAVALTDAEHPLLVVDLRHEPGRTFRVVPREAWGVENNLSLANIGFEDFADALDADGVFRGFPEPGGE